MLKVLQVVPSLRAGGAERMAVDLALNITSCGVQSALVSLEEPAGSHLERDLRDRGIEGFHCGKRPGFDPRMFPRLRQIIQRYEPDIVHTHLSSLRYVYPLLRSARGPVGVHTIHNVADQEVEPRLRWLSRIAFQSRVTPVTIARRVDDTFVEVYGFQAPALIPNGIDVKMFSTADVSREAWRRCEGFTENDILVVCVARMSEQKNHALLIDAFGQAVAMGAEARLLLVGDGELRSEIEIRVSRSAARDRVHFLGVRADVASILGASDLFALPSTFEGNPLSVMEAMAAGLPVVATAVGGVPELVDHEHNGLLVRPNDCEAMSAAMCHVVADADYRSELSVNARQKATTFGADRMAESYALLYKQLLLRAPSNRAGKTQ